MSAIVAPTKDEDIEMSIDEEEKRKKDILRFGENDDDIDEEEWFEACLRPNKGDVSNFATFFIFLFGCLLRSVYGSKNQVAGWILAFGLFGFAGGITNWLAVKMLFDRVPLLVGSGVIPRRFKEILQALKTMILDTFFEEEFLRTYINERKVSLLASLDFQGRLRRGMNVPGFDEDLARKLETLSQTPDGIILATIAPMFGGFEAMVPMIKPMLIAVGVELLHTITHNFDIADVIDVTTIRDEIGQALDQRMTTLTPKKVKRMMSQVGRNHLGWLVVWETFGGLIGIISFAAGYSS